MEITKIMFPEIKRDYLETLQINIGYKCNQACSHCHVNSSPSRTEMMSDDITVSYTHLTLPTIYSV